jgi:plasmid stabilization system protein ParE
MTFRVILLPGAESDLEGAFTWISEHSPDAAARWLAGIDAAVSTLREMPLRAVRSQATTSAAKSSCGKCSTADGTTGIAFCAP